MTTPSASVNLTGAGGARHKEALIIAFIDLTRYREQSERADDAEQAEAVDAFYHLVWNDVRAAGGTTVKFIGDAALIVFPRAAADVALVTMLALADRVDRAMADRGWKCHLRAKVHAGDAIVGPFGPTRQFDVIGSSVSATAMLRSHGITLSAVAYNALSPDARRRLTRDAGAETWSVRRV